MVNSKKMSKSSIAVIVLSILLVLSMILGLTGAWFSAYKEANNGTGDAIQFGEVKITSASATSQVETSKKYLPGDTVTAKVSFVNASNVAIYYGYEIVAEIYNGDNKLGDTYVTSDLAAQQVKELAADTQAEETTITFSFVNTAEDNTLNGKAVTMKLSLKVYAIQQEHMDKPESVAALKGMVTAA